LAFALQLFHSCCQGTARTPPLRYLKVLSTPYKTPILRLLKRRTLTF